MRLPTFQNLSEEQLLIYEYAPDAPLFVLGPPGSGKTTMAIWRARYLATAPLNRNVTVLTRNRLLVATAGQMARGDVDRRQVDTATMHQFSSRAYYEKFGRCIPEPLPFVYNWEQAIADYAAIRHIPTLDHLIIDEAQNLPIGFIRWAVQFGAKVVTVFADEDQTTLAEHSTVRDICAAGMPQPRRLTKNFRNGEEIASLMEQFHIDGILPPARVTQGRMNEQPRLLQISTWDMLVADVVQRYRNQRYSIGVIVDSHASIRTVVELLKAALPTVRIDFYASNLPAKAEHAIVTRAPGVTVLTSESAIGLEFDAAYVQDLSSQLPPNDRAKHRRLYMLCARAQRSLILVDGPTRLTAAQLASLPDERYLAR
ncbi:Viral (Superfamily 1) RNA helicase [compost metagenome]